MWAVGGGLGLGDAAVEAVVAVGDGDAAAVGVFDQAVPGVVGEAVAVVVGRAKMLRLNEIDAM